VTAIPGDVRARPSLEHWHVCLYAAGAEPVERQLAP
jgi:hypothetical protein